MNVYDFDHTIYRGDSTLDFWRFCIVRHPSCLLTLPQSLVYAVRFQLGKCSREEFKETFYGFLRHVPDVETEVQEFWNTHMDRFMPWYESQKRADDIIISASPDFLISAACLRLGVRWIASRVDAKTGKLLGANCRGEEKVHRLLQEYPGAEVDCFYSDSTSDALLAALSAKPFLVKHGQVKEWNS